MTSWIRVRDTDTGAVYSTPEELVLESHQVLDEPGADKYGRPLPTWSDGKSPALYDPASELLDQVLGYLEQADETERARVIQAESTGKARKGVLEWTPQPPTA